VSLTSVKEYFTPDGKEEFLELLNTHGDGALIVAGGSFVHGLDARDLLSGIEVLIDIKNLGLNQVTSDSAGLSVGAMVTFAELQQVQAIGDSAAFGAIRDALNYPPVQIRNVATIGGNIASACPYFDLPTAVMSLGALVHAQGQGGIREIPVEDFFDSLFQNTLESNEYVSGLFFPALPERSASAFTKLETNANDLAIVNTAVQVTLDDAGICQEARIAIGGGVAETPVRAVVAEALLQGERISDELTNSVGDAVRSELQPMSDHRASAAYRSLMAKTLTERTLRRAVARLDQ
jgi:CO/xanthine dehydrogenase FAD-binding subunit